VHKTQDGQRRRTLIVPQPEMLFQIAGPSASYTCGPQPPSGPTHSPGSRQNSGG
jgi:hypothetical protein